MTIEELGAVTRVDAARVRAFEAGAENADILEGRALARALGTTLESLEPTFLLLVEDQPSARGFRGRSAGRVAPARRASADAASFRADYEQHFDVSHHALVNGEVPPEYAAWIDAELELSWGGPSDAQLRDVADLDSLRDAWLALGQPASAPVFRLWFDAHEPGEPVAAGLVDRDRAARRAGSTGLRGGAYECERCRVAHLDELHARRFLGSAGRPTG